MNDIDDPLWRPGAKADDDLIRIERVLSPLGVHARGIAMPAVPYLKPRRVRTFKWAMAASVAVAILASGFQYRLRWQDGASWPVTSIVADVTTSTQLEPGRRIATKSGQSAHISVARIGTISLSPDSRLRLKQTRTGQHRVSLERGHMRARIWAPPGYFGVESGAAEIVDLGCDFDVWKLSDGTGRVYVRSGWVRYQIGAEEILVAEGYQVSFDQNKVGTPLRMDASPALARAVGALDSLAGDTSVNIDGLATVIAKNARDQDALTLLSVLTHWPRLAGTDIYPRLASALRTSDKSQEHRLAWERGDIAAVNAWWDRLPRQPKRWLLNWTDVLP